MKNVNWHGQASDSESGIPTLLFTAAGTGTAISIRSIKGVVMEGIHVRYDNSAFTGILVESGHDETRSDTSYLSILRCTFDGTDTAFSAAVLLSLDKTIIAEVKKSHFLYAALGIRGIDENLHNFSPSDVSVTNNWITITNHRFRSGDQVQFSSTGTLPAPLISLTQYAKYYVIRIDDNTIRLAATKDDATAPTPVPIILTSTGSGTHKIGATGTYSYVIDVTGNSFNFIALDILNPSANWNIVNNTFEPNRDGKMIAIDTTIPNYFSRNMNINNNYFGDASAQTEPVIRIYGGLGVAIANNWMYLALTGAAIVVEQSIGVNITGNRIEGASKFLQYTGATSHNIFIAGNSLGEGDIKPFGTPPRGEVIFDYLNSIADGLSISGYLNPSNKNGIDFGGQTTLIGSNSSAQIGLLDSSINSDSPAPAVNITNQSLGIQSPSNTDLPIVFLTFPTSGIARGIERARISGAGLKSIVPLSIGTASAAGTPIARIRHGDCNLQSGGTCTVMDSSVTNDSHIFLTGQDSNVTGTLKVSGRTLGTSFTIASSNASDSGKVAWQIVEP